MFHRLAIIVAAVGLLAATACTGTTGGTNTSPQAPPKSVQTAVPKSAIITNGGEPLVGGRPGGGSTQAATYTDVFAYCSAVGNIDAADSRWAGPALPDPVLDGIIRAVTDQAPTGPDQRQFFATGTVWRCMGGQVYACNAGANIPCLAKANTSRTPNAGMVQYCRENAGAGNIPAVATGRETVYEWSCQGTTPAPGRQFAQPDARGFLSNVWYAIRRT